jgi:putative oxidoreductase
MFTSGHTTDTLLLRLTTAFILLSHALPGMLDGGVNAFGELYLNKIGFSPIGVPLAWLIKSSHVVAALFLVVNKYIKIASIASIFVLVMGIAMVHLKDGWFVVGGGRNGIEYNVLLIAVLLSIIFQKPKHI